jgi:hypothetical protein
MALRRLRLGDPDLRQAFVGVMDGKKIHAGPDGDVTELLQRRA